jgi:hypothetical protein
MGQLNASPRQITSSIVQVPGSEGQAGEFGPEEVRTRVFFKYVNSTGNKRCDMSSC